MTLLVVKQPVMDATMLDLTPIISLKSANKKVLVSVRYSPEVITYFKSTGEGWQSLMDSVFRKYVARHSRGA